MQLNGQLNGGEIYDQHVNSNAGIDVTKLKHAYLDTTDFDIAPSSTPTTQTRVLKICQQAGTIRSFEALLVDSGSSTSITFDLQKSTGGGAFASVLTAPITIVHGTGDRVVVAASIASQSFVANDIFQAVMTVTSSTGAQGPFAQLATSENAAP